MWLQATFTSEDIERALALVTPARLSLDPQDAAHRYLWLGRPESVSIRGGVGLRIETAGHLEWDVIGLRVPVTLRSMTILLSPMIARVEQQDVLAFACRLEAADLSAVPSFLEVPLIARVNEALARPEARLMWRFMETLDFRFALPKLVQPSRDLGLFARAGAVRVTDGAITLAVSWGLDAGEPSAAAELPMPPAVAPREPERVAAAQAAPSPKEASGTKEAEPAAAPEAPRLTS